MILTPLQKLTKNGEDWGKLIVAKGCKKLPKVQNIVQSGHTVWNRYHTLDYSKFKTTLVKFCKSSSSKYHWRDKNKWLSVDRVLKLSQPLSAYHTLSGLI